VEVELTLPRGRKLIVRLGDLTEQQVDAIVNPANSLMIMGGGVALAIKQRGGAVIEKEARKYAPVPVGRAVVTTGGQLAAKYVIHAPTMPRPAMRTTVDNVRAAVRAALHTATDLQARTVAFPGMGTGVGRVPIDKAVRAMAEEALQHPHSLPQTIVFVARTPEAFNQFVNAVQTVLKEEAANPS